MPSTYSPELRIELIANGDQSGSWGNTTNSNLGTLIESAISGYVAVSVTSANQALTAINGAADEARNALIELTTTTTANFAVYIPPSSKLYIVRNSSAYSATIYCSTVIGNTIAAGTGVVIPAGKTCVIWTAGTNVTEQLNHIVGAFSTTGSLAVGGNATVTGTLAVTGDTTFTGIPSGPTAAAGTNTTQLATTAYVQASLTPVFPIGSIYINASNSTNPATLFGFGTWVAFGAGRVPVGFNAANPLFDTAEETGGSADSVVVSHTHTATVTDPGHAHSYTVSSSNTGTTSGPTAIFNLSSSSSTSSASTGISVSNSTAGVSGTNGNYQPFITVYMWKRTA